MEKLSKETRKIIYYRKGDESYPKTEDLSKDDWSEYIFSDIYEKAATLIADIVRINIEDKENYKRNIEITKNISFGVEAHDAMYVQHANCTRNNLVAFVGERGSGKTSCLQTIYNGLPEINKRVKLHCVFDINLPIIDPSYFNEHSNILEIVIAQMFQVFKDALQHPEKYFLPTNYNLLEKKRNLVKCFQDVKETLDCINKPIKTSDINDSVEALSKMAASNNLKRQMEVLVDAYLSYFHVDSKSVLVIAIDDLDVQTKHTYKMLEQISKYLIINKVVILIGVKLKQLSDLVKQNYYYDFHELLSKNHIGNNQIDDMTSRYLLKLIPFSHRLMLPSLNEITNARINIMDGEESKKISQFILELIYERTRITFYNSLEQESLIIPHNFREMLNLLSFLLKLPEVDNINKKSVKKETIIKNRNSFKYYFINSWCLDKLSSEQYLFVKELLDCDVVQINKFIVDALYRWHEHYFSRSKAIDIEIFNTHNRGYNISIADVQTVLDVLSTNNDVKIKRLVFAIKTVYSMFLYEKFYEMRMLDKIDKSCAELVTRSNHTIQKNWMSNNKLNYLSDYEILIGGNILNIYVQRSVDEIYHEDKLYAGVINGQELANIYNDIISLDLLKQTKNEQKKIIELNQDKFNTFEFMLLCTLVENNLPNYRTFKHCYYDAFPINELSTEPITFSFTSILSNAIHLYKLYQIYYSISRQNNHSLRFGDEIRSINQFFSLVECFNNKSIIFRILHVCGDESSIDVESTRFVNQFLEEFFLINIEEIDVIENYLGHINKPRYVNKKKQEFLSLLNELNEDYESAITEKRHLREEERYLLFRLTELAKIFDNKENVVSKKVHNEVYQEYENLKKHLDNVRKEFLKLDSKVNSISNRIEQRKKMIMEINKEDKDKNIKSIKTFFDKFCDFQYIVENRDDDKLIDVNILLDRKGYINSLYRRNIKKFDFLQPIVDAFGRSNFVEEFYRIYSNGESNNN